MRISALFFSFTCLWGTLCGMDPLLESVMMERTGFFRSQSMHSPLPGASYQVEQANTILYSSGINYAVCNGVMQMNETSLTDAEINKMIAYFSDRNLPFMWWTSANLENKGFQYGGTLLGIAVDLGSCHAVDMNPDVEVKMITEDQDLQMFCQHIVNAFGMDPAVLDQYFVVSKEAMKQGEQVHFMAFVNGQPVGTVSLSKSMKSAGIWNLSTLPEYRKSGVGTAVVTAAMNEAKRCGYAQVMALLMPKGMARGLFTKLGFKEVCEFPFYVYGVSAENLEK